MFSPYNSKDLYQFQKIDQNCWEISAIQNEDEFEMIFEISFRDGKLSVNF